MGGVVNAITNVAKKAVDTVVDIGKKTIDAVTDVGEKIVDASKKIAEVMKDSVNLVIDTTLAPFKIVYDTIIKGESFNKSIASNLQTIGKDLGNFYDSFIDDILGIDDNKFLGIKGVIFSQLGMLVKDFTHDHATETVAIGVIVAAIVASFFFPPAGELAATISMAMFDLGVTASITALNAIYFISYGIYLLGSSMLISGIISGAVLAMYPSLLDNILFFEQNQELLRIAALSAIMSGSIFDRLAGGVIYDSQYAGGVYYDAGTCANPTISVGGEFYLSPQAINLQFGYQDTTLKNLAGDENFTVIKPT
jgi:hypothetical protein